MYEWLFERKKTVLFSGRLNVEMLSYLKPKIIVSYNYGFIIKEDVIDFMHRNIVNLHISYLPWNRGASPNIWSFIENSPKGVTIHKIDRGLDTGEIIARKRVEFDESKETLASSYEKLNEEIVSLFKEKWYRIESGNYKTFKSKETGSYHTKKDLECFLRGKEINYQKLLEEYNW